MQWLNVYKMRIVLIGFVAAIVLGGGSAKADCTWMDKADMPTPRKGHTSAVVNDKIYVMGGSPSEGTGSLFSTVEEFDPAINVWTRKKDMPIARGALSSSVVNGKIYAIGGTYLPYASTSYVEEYDPATDTWTRKADMPTPRRWLATCAVNGRIYAIGGLSGSAVQGLPYVEQYDPATDTWTRKANMPMGLWGLRANAVNGKLYVLGGRPSYTAIPNVQEYDPATDTWTQKAYMPVGTSQMASVVLDDKIVLIGGWLHSNNFPYTTVQTYDPETNTWVIEGESPFMRAICSASVVNNKIYVIGGTDRPHPCPATSTVYEGIIQKSCDFNGDGIVDSADVCIMVDYWGTDEWFCDIAPSPFGDGIVDVEDLKVLAEHLFEDYRLIAHWKLDETEGDIAYDSVKTNDAVVIGYPLWQPDSGIVAGALQFDGIDDYIDAPFVLDPSTGPLSAVAWIKGGAPGQVIISQQDGTGNGAIWLGADLLDGKLMTALSPPAGGRSSKPSPLDSDFLIIDDDWHCICVVVAGQTSVRSRYLYLDGVMVASDNCSQLNNSNGGLIIGAGKNLDADTLFSGLIDDVRIYNQALTPEEIAALAQ